MKRINLMDAESICTREFVPADYDSVMALWEEVKEVEICEGDSREEIRDYLVRNPELSCVAETQGILVGAALCGHDGRRGFIYHLAVAAACRGRGVGRMLLEHCITGLRAAGMTRAIILVAGDNPLGRQFWIRNGWEKIEGAFPMGRDL